MSVTLYFGLPGCGKTTLFTKNVIDQINSGLYDHVYGNVHLDINGYTYIDNDCIGVYNLENAAINVDEGQVFADNRAYKSFPKHQLVYFVEHRHFNVNFFIYTQQWDGLDKKIRSITDRVYYVFKDPIFGKWITTYYKIPYDLIIPDGKKAGSGEKLGEIIQGYCKPNIIVRLFARKIYRPLYYEYFDSWERYDLPQLPDCYNEFYNSIYERDHVYVFKYYLDVCIKKFRLFIEKLHRNKYDV